MAQHLSLKALRLARGWTQQQAAEYFGVDKATFWRWEKEGIPSRGPSRRFIEQELISLESGPAPSPSEAA
jgi:transcriptional regulator with XRE-family HTH domain